MAPIAGIVRGHLNGRLEPDQGFAAGGDPQGSGVRYPLKWERRGHRALVAIPEGGLSLAKCNERSYNTKLEVMISSPATILT